MDATLVMGRKEPAEREGDEFCFGGKGVGEGSEGQWARQLVVAERDKIGDEFGCGEVAKTEEVVIA